MAIKIEKTKRNQSHAIKDNAGFTFILKNNSEGFGFVYLVENDIIITVIVKYENGIVDHFSTLINDYDETIHYSTVEEFLTDYFDYGVESIKVYKQIDDMNIIVDF